ncbi:MAG TPA: hypothetical protein VK157_17295 [Phycisphaerales bacterium]|nr:hypothetical protein [Phycisphaerales bacterium]
MIEGWHGNDYVVLFDATEAAALSARYDIGKYLPGYTITGLLGWDDFIVKGDDGRYWTLPTMPCSADHIAPLKLDIDAGRVVADERFRGKLKWYTTPLVFGGSPADESNVIWVTLDQHVELVKWWNDRYHKLR